MTEEIPNRRSGVDRRNYSPHYHVPERRSGNDRRNYVAVYDRDRLLNTSNEKIQSNSTPLINQDITIHPGD